MVDVFELSDYFDDWEVKEEFSQQYISLWDGWLGKNEYYKLNEVSKSEWERFNNLIKQLHANFELYAVNLKRQEVTKLIDLDNYLPTLEEDLNREQLEFTTIIVPALKAVLAETWDYTYIIYHTGSEAVKALAPFINANELFCFRE